MRNFVLAGMLLGGAASLLSQFSLADPRLDHEKLRWFLLTETKDQVRRALGQPKDVAEFGSDFVSWQYQTGDEDEGNYSHQLVFRRSTGQLISVTRNYDRERLVDLWFPQEETSVHYFPDEKNPQFGLRLRHLSEGRVLMAMGAPMAGQKTGQIVLMRESEIRFFYPWLADQLVDDDQLRR